VGAAAAVPGALLLSTTGEFFVSGASGADEDVVRFSVNTLGSNTSGTLSLLLDLSALGIVTSENSGSLEFKE
jgi:hypothetical protein